MKQQIVGTVLLVVPSVASFPLTIKLFIHHTHCNFRPIAFVLLLSRFLTFLLHFPFTCFTSWSLCQLTQAEFAGDDTLRDNVMAIRCCYSPSGLLVLFDRHERPSISRAAACVYNVSLAFFPCSQHSLQSFSTQVPT